MGDLARLTRYRYSVRMTHTPLSDTEADAWVADDSTFGARLALIRQRMQWGNVAEAARECGLPVDSWRHWERDNMEPRRLVTIAMAIATRTRCDLNWLLYGPTKATHQQRAETTHWLYVNDILSPSEQAEREGRVVHRDGRRRLQKPRSGRQGRRVRIATGTPAARVSVN